MFKGSFILFFGVIFTFSKIFADFSNCNKFVNHSELYEIKSNGHFITKDFENKSKIVLQKTDGLKKSTQKIIKNENGQFIKFESFLDTPLGLISKFVISEGVSKKEGNGEYDKGQSEAQYFFNWENNDCGIEKILRKNKIDSNLIEVLYDKNLCKEIIKKSTDLKLLENCNNLFLDFKTSINKFLSEMKKTNPTENYIFNTGYSSKSNLLFLPGLCKDFLGDKEKVTESFKMEDPKNFGKVK